MTKTLWTPWRMAYITSPDKDGGCIFDFDAGTQHDIDNLLLYNDGTVTVMLNRYPYANGHLLVSPRRHTAELTDLSDIECAALMAMLKKATHILKMHLNPDGFNIGLNLGSVAGAGKADHLHYHVVPRWEGDHNYMTVLAEIRTIPQHIEQTFTQLLAEFQNLPNPIIPIQ